MNDIPHFAEAVKEFARFLTDNGHPGEVFWVFREDLWRFSMTQVLVKYPPPLENVSLAQKVFADGRARGLIEINAFASDAHKVAATIWIPKYPDEEVQGWDRGMKLSINQPLPDMRVVAAFWWGFITLLPRFGRFQRTASFIGTRTWAAA